MRRVDDQPRRIFPALLSDSEKTMLTYLSKASQLSRSGVLRRLILRETATRQLAPAPPETQER
jgi:hypothetical protein